MTPQIRYDAEMLDYLKRTGLQPSDLVKPRQRKKDKDGNNVAKEPKPATPARQTKKQQRRGATSPTGTANTTSSGQTSPPAHDQVSSFV